ncbi:MAG: hypothetical protein ACPGLV_00785 [Bacteroidia bacterium]
MTNKLVAKRIEILGWIAIIALQYPVISLLSNKFIILNVPVLHWYILFIWLIITARLFVYTKRLSRSIQNERNE